MPRCGDISIDYMPDATEGFRLGLMADLGLSPAEETQEPEPISETQVLQWKRMCEVEFAKRGILMHDWSAEPFGISSLIPRSRPRRG